LIQFFFQNKQAELGDSWRTIEQESSVAGRGEDVKKRGQRSGERININCNLIVKQALICNSKILEQLKKTRGRKKFFKIISHDRGSRN
jgi:hypothetical protein